MREAWGPDTHRERFKPLVSGCFPAPRVGDLHSIQGRVRHVVAPASHRSSNADGIDITSVYMGLIHTRMSEPTPSLRRPSPGMQPDEAGRTSSRRRLLNGRCKIQPALDVAR